MTHRIFVRGACLVALTVTSAAAGRTFEVGPGRALPAIGQVPWESLQPGDVVRIHWRPEPYREKWNISTPGTADAPIRVVGVPDPKGGLPVIDGQDALTRPDLDFPGQARALIRVGCPNGPEGSVPPVPAHVVIEHLEIRGARVPNRFTGRNGIAPYLKHAAGIYIAQGSHVTIRGCVIHDCGNGLMSSGAETLVESCHIFGNGNPGSLYEHNVYTSSSGMVFQSNRLGLLRDGSPGNNFKDRSAGLIVRYNWIEGGNRQLDLVDANDHHAPLSREARYRETLVYGNILVEPAEAGNSQIIHYGGDSGEEEFYRRGILRLYGNTILSFRQGPTTLIRFAGGGAVADCRNNIVWLAHASGRMHLGSGDGRILLAGNWLPERVTPSFGVGHAPVVQGFMEARKGGDPGFLAADRADFRLRSRGAPCAGLSVPLPADFLQAHGIAFQYHPHGPLTARPAETLTLPGAMVATAD
ncbi:MAG: right-handed parallel beta-helix repeat-containing protein [Verrucomicrobia bacterium]|nr:right-handed parallel beta-helix repeat-containing protein [Verrucomicrobiota bacterium]